MELKTFENTIEETRNADEPNCPVKQSTAQESLPRERQPSEAKVSAQGPDSGKNAVTVDSEDSQHQQFQSDDVTVRRLVQFEQRESIALVALAILATLYAIYFTRAITLPITFAMLTAMTLRPITRRIYRWGIPTSASAVLILAGLSALSVIGFVRILQPAQEWMADAPQNVAIIKQKLSPYTERISSFRLTGQTAEESQAVVREVDEPIPVEIKQSELSSNFAVMSTTGNVVGSVVLVFALTFFLLTYGDDLINSVLHLMPRFSDKRRAVEMLYSVERGIASYLMTVTCINAVLGVTVAVAMWFCHVPNPGLWGFMAFAFNYVPILGALAGFFILLAMSFLTFDSVAYSLVPPLIFIVLTTIEGNFLTPSILGRRMNLNPILVFVALIFWGWAWGLGGAILAVPLLAITKIACEAFERTRPIAILLGDTNERGDPPAVKT